MTNEQRVHYEMLKDFQKKFSRFQNDWILSGGYMKGTVSREQVRVLDLLIDRNNTITHYEAEHV